MTDRNVRVHKQHLKLNRVDVGAKKAGFAVELDVFDKNVPINKMTDICQLCKGDHFDGELMHKRFTSLEGSGEHEDGERESCPDELDPEGIWASRYSIQNNSNRRLFVHFNCALYAPQISFNGVTWSNMRKEIQRGNFLSCFHCRKKGSTILCSQTRCNYIVHLSCAVKEGFRPSRFVNTAGYFCRIHAAENSAVEKELDKQVESDISLGRETIPVIKRDDSEDTPLPQGFEYITRNVDSDSVTATPQNVCSDEFQCCDCVGLCNDINQCACLQAEYQRNYSSAGKLIPGAEKPIIECNMRCNCSVNRCTNRVVERGLQYPLQIFRRKSPVGNVLMDCVDKNNGTSAIGRKRPRQSGFDDKVRRSIHLLISRIVKYSYCHF
jgi:Pre-SET motif/PHD-like zinc-binding domain